MPKKGKGKKGGSKGGKKEVPATALRYNGPIMSRADKVESDLNSTVLKYVSFIYSDASGKMIQVWGSAPSSCQDWADYIKAWGEYRTLGVQLKYYPSNRYSKLSTACQPLASVVSRENGTALSTYLAAAGSSSYAMKSLEDPFQITVKMEGVDESEFIPVSSPTDFYWIKLYGELNSVSTLYGLVEVIYRVQFRGRT